MFDEAIERAQKLQAQLEDPDFVPPALFGLPISLKDSFQVKSTDASIGQVFFAEQVSTTNSALVDLLLAQGAVFYCKTNIPQTLMTADSDNNVFGRTLNPANKSLTAGGSTGGEGALIALRGSIAGIGSDIAGSIRIPSHCNGIYGFRPSAGIVPMFNDRDPGREGLSGIAPVSGPLAVSARSCAMLLRVIIEAEPWKLDPQCLHLNWCGHSQPRRQLRIGLISNDGQFTPTPPMRRALRETGDKLMSAGFYVVPIILNNVAKDMELVWDSFSMDGSKVCLDFVL